MTQFNELYQEALDLGTDDICRIKGDKCIAVRLGLKKRLCSVCADSCDHFDDGCLIKNIGCKVWLCPQMEQFQTDKFKKRQEDILKKANLLRFNQYCLTVDEIKSGVVQPFGVSTNKRLDNVLHK